MEGDVAALPAVSEPESSQTLSGLGEESREAALEEMDTTEHKEAAASGEEKQASPAPSSPHSSINSPLLPLPDFMTALNMMPSGKPPQSVGKGEGAGQQPAPSSQDTTQEEELSLGPGPKEVLIEKFKQNPNGVLDLLQSALSIEKLSSLLQDEHKGDNDLLMQLQNRLEAAYHTLRECEGTKGDLAKKISASNQQITEKRKHLEELRGELKILGDEELRLKRKRDISHNKYAEMRKKLTCSSEALEQISLITRLMDPTGSGSGAGTPTPPTDTTATSAPVSMAGSTTITTAMPATAGNTEITPVTAIGGASSTAASTNSIAIAASTSGVPTAVAMTTTTMPSGETASMATNAGTTIGIETAPTAAVAGEADVERIEQGGSALDGDHQVEGEEQEEQQQSTGADLSGL